MVAVTNTDNIAKMNRRNNRNVTVTAKSLADRGYSLTRAAAAAGVSVTHLRKVCQGERKASAELLGKLEALPAYHPVRCLVNY